MKNKDSETHSASGGQKSAGLTIDWQAASSGGSSFKSRVMLVKDSRIIFKKSKQFTLFHLPVLIPGVLAILVGLPFFMLEGDLGMVIFMLVFGTVLTGLSLYSLLKEKAFTIDLKRGEYYWEKQTNKAPVKNIQALQILAKFICNTSSPYTSYELNLILINGERVTVLDLSLIHISEPTRPY